MLLGILKLTEKTFESISACSQPHPDPEPGACVEGDPQLSGVLIMPGVRATLF